MGKEEEIIEKSSWEYIAKSLFAGGISGVFAKTVTAPLDRVKILFQGFNPSYLHHVGKPLGVFKAALHIHETHGIRGLYQGHSVMVLRIFPSAAIRFMSYEQIKLILIPSKEYNNPWRHFLAGSLAGNIGVLATYPLEVIRSRMAFEIRSSSGSNTFGIFSTIRKILLENDNSIRGFYKGFGATMVGIVPYAGAAFTTYQYLKSYLIHTHPLTTTYKAVNKRDGKERNELKVGYHLAVGGVAGMIGQTVAYPFDTVRHRMQLQGVSNGFPVYRSTIHALKSILSTEGLRAMYIGLSINYWKTIPANAVAFVVYDAMKNFMDIGENM